MKRLARRAIMPLLTLVVAGCSAPPVASIERAAPAPRSTGPSSDDAAALKGCRGATRIQEEASKLISEGRYLRAAVRLDEAEALCRTRDPGAIILHVEALSEIGRCARLQRFASTGAVGQAVEKAAALCAERTRGIGDEAAEKKSRDLAREGQKTLVRGDLALTERLAGQALAAAATEEALLLDARAQSLKGDKERARRSFDRAFAALERGGKASVVVVPHAVSRASREDGATVVSAGGRLWILRRDIPDRAVTMLRPDAEPSAGYVNTASIVAAASGRFAVAGKKGVGWLDIETSRYVDNLAVDDPSLWPLEGGLRALVFKGPNPERTDSTMLVDLTDPARLKVIAIYAGGAPYVADDGSAFVLKTKDGIDVIDAATGKVVDSFNGALSGAISSDGKLVALCEITKLAQAAGSQEAQLRLYDRAKKKVRWSREGECFPTTPISFGPRDRTIYGARKLDVKNGFEAPDEDEPEPAAAPEPKAARADWLTAGFNETARGCTRALSGDGALVSAGCSSSGAEVFEARTGKTLYKSAKSMSLPPRGAVVVAEDSLCDVRRGSCASLAKHCKKGSVLFSSDATRVICASEEGLREVTWDDTLALREGRVFPGSKDWLPVFAGPRGVGVMRVSASAVELLILDFEKASAISGGKVVGGFFSPDGGSSVRATAGEPAITDYAADREGVLQGHAGMLGATLFSPDGKILGLKDSQQVWRFWDLPGGKLRGRFDALDRPKPQPDDPMLLSGSMGLTAQLLSTGYIAGALGSRNHWQLNLTQGFWLAPVDDPTRLIEARWNDKGGYLLETRRGSSALGEGRVALLGGGSAIIACAFGGAVAPLEVCSEAFVFNELATEALGAVPQL